MGVAPAAPMLRHRRRVSVEPSAATQLRLDRARPPWISWGPAAIRQHPGEGSTAMIRGRGSPNGVSMRTSEIHHRGLRLLCALGGVFLLGADPVEPKLLGSYEKWGAYAVQSPKGKHCFVYGEPTEQKGN